MKINICPRCGSYLLLNTCTEKCELFSVSMDCDMGDWCHWKMCYECNTIIKVDD
jgi:hypothetical protein